MVILVIVIAVVAFVWAFCKYWDVPDNVESKYVNLDFVVEVVNNNQITKKCIKATDIESMFREFKQTKIYACTILYLIDSQYEDEPDLKEFRKMLYSHFAEFRQFLHEAAPKVIDTDIEYCMLTLAGFKQKDMHKIMTNITQSGVRNIKPRLKQRLPSDLYHFIFRIDRTAY